MIKPIFAFSQVTDNRIYLCTKTQQELDDTKLDMQIVARGKQAAVAFSKTGELFIARLTFENKLFVAPFSELSQEIYIADNVQSFDIARSDLANPSNLICVYIKDQELFLAEKTDRGFGLPKKIALPREIVPRRVKLARGTTNCSVLIVTDTKGLNHICYSEADKLFNERAKLAVMPQVYIY